MTFSASGSTSASSFSAVMSLPLPVRWYTLVSRFWSAASASAKLTATSQPSAGWSSAPVSGSITLMSKV